MKVRIVSDGSRFGTRVENAETGEVIEGVYDVQISIAAGDPIKATLRMYALEFKLPAEADVLIACPMCKRELYQPITSDDRESAESPLSPGDPLQLPDEL